MYRRPLGIGHGWKDLRDLIPNDLMPMPHDVVSQEVQERGKRVQRPQG